MLLGYNQLFRKERFVGWIVLATQSVTLGISTVYYQHKADKSSAAIAWVNFLRAKTPGWFTG